MLNFAYNMDKVQIINGLLPGLELLAEGSPEVQKATLNQFVPLFSYIQRNYPQDGYKKAADTMMPILEKMLYSQTQDIRDKAISIIADLRTVVQEPEKEMIMAVTLRMAQDENEYNRESAVKLLNEIAPDMGQEICEYFIVPTFKSLGLDTHTFVRITVVKNLLNISNNVSLEYFSN